MLVPSPVRIGYWKWCFIFVEEKTPKNLEKNPAEQVENQPQTQLNIWHRAVIEPGVGGKGLGGRGRGNKRAHHCVI